MRRTEAAGIRRLQHGHGFDPVPAGKVSECSLARVKWNKTFVQVFANLRQTILKWQENKGPLKASLQCFKGSVNMVHLVDCKELPAKPSNEEMETLLCGVNASELKKAEELMGGRPYMDSLWRFLIVREFVFDYEAYAPTDVYMALEKMTKARNR